MKVSEIKDRLVRMIERDAYAARVFDELQILGIDAGMMKFYRDEAMGKAFGAMEMLTYITGKESDSLYEKVVEAARMDIVKANYDTVKLLNLAGFNGEEYVKLFARQ
jgi:hypothetical protein